MWVCLDQRKTFSLIYVREEDEIKNVHMILILVKETENFINVFSQFVVVVFALEREIPSVNFVISFNRKSIPEIQNCFEQVEAIWGT